MEENGMTSVSRRDLTTGAITAFACAAISPTGAATRKAAAVDPMTMVDPDFLPALVAIQPQIDKEIYNHRTLPTMRILSNSYAQRPGSKPHVTRSLLPGTKGAPDVPIYVIGQRDGSVRPAILHIHGGGYILGRAIDALPALQKLALTHDSLMVTIDYRLAPDTRFTGALEDNYAALRWLYHHAEELGVYRRRIAVMGESAGGGHAAALAIAARDRGELPICQQILFYPMLDDRTGSSRQPAPWIGTFIWNRAANRFGWSSLLGVPAGLPACRRGRCRHGSAIFPVCLPRSRRRIDRSVH